MVNNVEPETLSTRLRQAMGERSIVDLAEASKVSTRTIWRLLSASDSGKKGRPDSDTVVALAKALGCSVGWLLAGERT